MTVTYCYKALLRPVSFCTLPDDEAIQKGWTYVHHPETYEGGRYGVIALPRELTRDEMDRFGFQRVLYARSAKHDHFDDSDVLWPYRDVPGETRKQMAKRIASIGRQELAEWCLRLQRRPNGGFVGSGCTLTYNVAHEIFRAGVYHVGVSDVAERVLEIWDE